uniref:Glycosyltransferase n=1 Tax=Linum usitatissimum TaxID=4006 RepID=I2BH31_LINUS|nr:UDP-glycosyltransferase 1 [Linum usitatissimum]
MSSQQKPHVVIFPSPGMGHLIPFVELSKKLVLSHNLSVTVMIPSLGPPSKAQAQFLDSLPDGLINHIALPPANRADFPADAQAETLLCLTVAHAIPSLRDALKSFVEKGKRPVALIVDLFCTDAFDVASEFGVPGYVAMLSNAMLMSMVAHLPKLDEEVVGEYTDMKEPILFPGCRVAIHGSELPSPALNRKNDGYKWFLHNVKHMDLAEGVLINSFTDLEGETIRFLQKNMNKPIYPIGPIIQSGDSSITDPSGCIKWLDHQPDGSVLLVSFGSGGTLSSAQLTELALGLEASQKRFIWVVRSPNDAASNASYFSGRSSSNPFDFLPEGFVDRTKDRGLVVPSWAPQMQVLSHLATGGFMSHCGWNSTLESLMNGVPMIAWPLYAEQKMNAVLLEKDFGVALRPIAREDGVIGREEISEVVKELMEGGDQGAAVRKRMEKLKLAAAEAVGDEGSSTKSLAELVAKWTKGINN